MSSQTSEPPLTVGRTAVVARMSELATAVRGSRRELSIAGIVVTWIAAGVWLVAEFAAMPLATEAANERR